jgi:N12 class adenine-specific DNA methylase/DNA repair protein RadC
MAALPPNTRPVSLDGQPLAPTPPPPAPTPQQAPAIAPTATAVAPRRMAPPAPSSPTIYNPGQLDATAFTSPHLQRIHAPQERVQQQQARQSEQDAVTQQREAERAAKEAADFAKRSANTEAETTFRQTNRPFFTDAFGNIRPIEDDATFARKQQEAAEEAARQVQWKKQGRTTWKNPASGKVEPVEDDATFAQKQQEAAVKRANDLRQKVIDDELAKTTLAASDPARATLPVSARSAIEKEIKDSQEAARAALITRHSTSAKAVTGGEDWIPFNEAPSPEANRSKERLAKLQSGFDTDLDDEDLADLEADPATAPTAAKLRTLRTRLQADDENATWQQTQAEKAFDLKLKKTNPEEWARRRETRLASLSPADHAKALETEAGDFTARIAQHEQEAAPLIAAQQQFTQQLTDLETRAADARMKGIPAGELITLNGPDGPQDWPRDLAETYLRTQQQVETWQTENQDTLDLIQTRSQSLMQEQEALTASQAQVQEKAKAQRQADLQRLSQSPITRALGEGLTALDAEAEQRRAALTAKFPDPATPQAQEAFAALEADLQTKSTALQEDATFRQTTAQQAYAGIKERIAADPENPNIGQHFVEARQNLVDLLGITPKEADTILDDQHKGDWTFSNVPDRNLIQYAKEGGKLKEPTRILSTGDIVLNPELLANEQASKDAIAAATTTPAAKARALEILPALRAQWAEAMLPSFTDKTTPFFIDFNEWREKGLEKGGAFARLNPAEQLMQYLDERAADHPAAKLARHLGTGLYAGFMDLTTQGLSLAAMGANYIPTGLGPALSEGLSSLATANQDNSQAVSQTAAFDQSGLLTRGLGQGARILPSLAPSLGGGAIAQGALLAAARTTAGRSLIASALAATSRAKDAKTAFSSLQTTTGLVGAGTAGAAQTAGAQYADIYGELRTKGMSHQDAHQSAMMPALLSGAITAILTVGFGATGAEKLLDASAKTAVKNRFTNFLKQVGKGAVAEQPEEILDEMFSHVTSDLAKNPNKPVQQSINEFIETIPELAIAIGVMGGAGGGAAALRAPAAPKTSPEAAAQGPDPTKLPEVIAAAQAAVANYQPAPDSPLTPQAAAAVLEVAQGNFSKLTTGQLNALGWTRENGKLKPLKDYAGPPALEFVDKEQTTPILRQEILDAVDAAIPELGDTIGMDEAEAREFFQQKLSTNAAAPAEAPSPETATDVSGAVAPATTATDAPTQEGTPQATTAAPSEVSVPTSSTENPSIPSENPVNPANPVSPVQTPTEAERTEQLTNHLSALGLPQADAEKVAAHLVRVQGTPGDSYLENVVMDAAVDGPKSFKRILKQLGVSGALDRTKAKDNPLKAPADLDARLAALSQAASPVAVSTPAANAGVATPEPRGSSAQGAAAPAESGVDNPQGAAPATPAVSAPATVSRHSPNSRAGKLAAMLVADGSYTQQEADEALDEYMAARPKGTEQMTPIEEKKPLLKFLSARENRLNGGKLRRAQATPTATQAPTLEEAQAAAVAAQPVGSRRRARRAMVAMNQSLAQWGRAFDRVDFSPAARQRLEGGAMAVDTDSQGNTVLLVDLEEFAKQHSWSATSRLLSADTLSEEIIHALAKNLARKDKAFTDIEMAKLWDDLTPTLRQTVWEAYHARNLSDNPDFPKTPPADASQNDKATMAHEFLRMLVQKKAFTKRVTEEYGIDPRGLLARIASLLKKLSTALQDAITGAPKPLQTRLEAYQSKLLTAAEALTAAPTVKDSLTPQTPAKTAVTTEDNRAPVVIAGSPAPTAKGPASLVTGSTGTAYTDTNDAIDYDWAVVETGELTISNRDDGTVDPAYPQELQPRDRTSAGSESQVQDIAKNANLDRLSATNTVGDGAPIIGPDGVVESGNGRTMGIRRAYTRGLPSAATYKQRLTDTAASYGLTGDAVAKMKAPMLVRVRRTNVDRIAFVMAANVSTIAPKREIEQAKTDAKQIVPDIFETFVATEDGDIFTAANAEFIRGFIAAVVPPAERPAIYDAKGFLSQTGLRRLRNALFVYAYGDSKSTLNALARLTEDIEADGRNLVNALVALAPRFGEQNARIAAGALRPLSITADLAEALASYQGLKERGETVENWAAQATLPGVDDGPTDLQKALVTTLHEHRRSSRKLMAVLNRYAAGIDGLGDPKQASLFGDEPTPTQLELWDIASKAEPTPLAMARKVATKTAYERRIDALFAGSPTQRQGVKILDRADLLDLLGHGNKPLHLIEGAVGKKENGKPKHPGMTAAMWKKVPEWIENPVAAFRSQTTPDRLVLFAPELVNERPVRLILSPNGNLAGLNVHVLVNAYEEGGTQVTPVEKWVQNGDLVYLDQQKNPEFSKRSGLRLPRVVRQIQGTQSILTEADLVNYRQSTPLATASKVAPNNALKLYRKLKQLERENGRLTGTQAQTLQMAERKLGQSFFPFAETTTPQDFTLETETTGNPVNQAKAEQLRLFMANKRPNATGLVDYPAGLSLGLDRVDMPQVPTSRRGEFARWLNSQDIGLAFETVSPASLLPCQKHYDPEAVTASRSKEAPRRLLVSKDNRVLDGHHQWQAALEDNRPLDIVRLSLNARPALELLKSFPVTTAYTGTRYESEEYQYLSAPSASWQDSQDSEASIVNPIDPSLSPDAKVDALSRLSDENIPLVRRILGEIKAKVKINGKHSKKLPDRIQAKASRPSIRQEKPWHDIEHIRDGLRFKVQMETFAQAPQIMAILIRNGVRVIKLDTKKMTAPKLWGWRFVAWDLQMPNGQLVEFYAPLPELDDKAVKGPNHHLFERWRNVPADVAFEDPQWRIDVQTSKARYDAAYRTAITRMGYKDEAAAEASWINIVAALESSMKANFSMPSTAEMPPRTQDSPGFFRNPPTSGIETATSPFSASNANGRSLIDDSFTVEGSTDSDGYQGKLIQMARKTRDAGPSLFSFDFTGTNTSPAGTPAPDLGFTSLLTPAQQEARLQAAEQLDLFGGTPNARPRPTSQRPPQSARPPRTQVTPETAPGADDLFGQAGLAPATGRPGRPMGDGNPGGQPGGERGSGNDATGGTETGGTGTDTTPTGNPESRPDSDLSGVPGGSADADALTFTRPDVGSPARNFEIPADLESLAPATDRAKINANMEAIRLLKELEADRRNATPEEKAVLASYTGWGAFKEAFNTKYEEDIASYWDGKPEYQRQNMPDWLQSWERNHRANHKLLRAAMTDEEFASASASTLNAHYTALPIIRFKWKLLEHLGFKGGRAIESSAGNGHYLGTQPRNLADATQWQTVELDELSARLLAKLYPEATVNEERPDTTGTRAVTGLGFERARIPNGSIDLATSNVPFHESGPSKKGFPTLNLHNFFFAHALDKVKPGGLVAFITSESTMQNNIRQRDFIASKGDLVAAFRLPNNAFKANAGTEVTTDIIIIRKPDGTPFKGEQWRNLVEVGRQNITLTQGKDQSADEFRREAERMGDVIGKEFWKGDKRALTVSAPIMVNEYFVKHPTHALGQHTLASTMYRAGGYALVAPEGFDVTQALDALIPTLPSNIMGQQTNEPSQDVVLAGRDDKPFSFKEQDGKLYEVQPDGSMEEAEWGTNPEMVKTWRSWRRLADTVQRLVAAETSDSQSDEAIEKLRRELNTVYNTHVANHKFVSRRFSNQHRHLYSDPSYPLTAALENEVITVDRKTGKKTYNYRKADIFTKRVGRPIVEPTTADNIDTAIETSLAWRGRIDPAYAASLLNISPAQFQREALQRPNIFRNPTTGMLETAEDYLTGNVRVKLQEAQTAAQDDPQVQRNVDALQKAQPERREISRIAPMLGARWIPAEVYQSFITNVLQGDDTVEYIPAGNTWVISGTGLYRTEEYGTERKGPATLFKHALNMTEPLVYDGRGDDRTFNPAATAAAKVALDKMRRAFIDYSKTSDAQVTMPDGTQLPVWEAVENAFNDSQNSYVNPAHTGSYLTFPGLNTDYVYTRAHRRAVIARFLATRRGMMAHGVGSGKTFNQIILSQELRRLGLAKKPMIVVQNATLGQFAKSYLKAYPGAKVLVPTKTDFKTQNRRKIVAKIATGDWDAVILPHSQFNKISNRPEAVKAYMDGQIDEMMSIVNKTKDKAKVRDLEGMIKRLRDRRQKMLDALAAHQDIAVMWEDLGIDALIMDEAHNYKSLPIITRMGRVKGVPASGDSECAINFMLKCRDVQAKTGGKNIFLATGTPIKNSMAEAYIMMQFMAPDVLEDFKIYNFDDFATTYGQTVTEAEMAWGGTPKMETRFAKFQNGPSLVTMIRTMFDVAFGNEALGLDVPKVKGGEPEMVIVPATPIVDQFNAWTRSVNDAWQAATPDEKEEFSAVPIQTMAAGIAAALDPRLISPNVQDHPDSKVNEAVRRVLAIHKAGESKRTTQIVFSDLRNPFSMDYLEPFTGLPFKEGTEGEFDLYKDLQKKLIAGGVPANEVHLMQSGMTDVQKAALFEKVDAGEIRIIIGSTELLGVGVNIQTRLKAVHHLMPPRDFTPAMMEQRNGRIIRQGNLHAEKVEGQPAWNEEVEIVNYGTEGSMDSAIYGTLARKQRFITQLLMGDNVGDTFDDPTDPVAVNMAEMAARTLGDPDFIRRIELEREIKELRLQAEAFTTELSGKRSRLSRLESEIRTAPETRRVIESRAEKAKVLFTRTAPRPEGVKEDTDISDKAVYQFGSQTIDTAAKDGSITNKLDLHLLDISTTAERRGKASDTFILTINGNPVNVRVDITIPGQPTSGAILTPEGYLIVGYAGAASLIQQLRRMDTEAQRELEFFGQRLQEIQGQADRLRSQLAQIGSFPEADRLAELELEAREVDERIRAKTNPQAAATTPAATKDPSLLLANYRSSLDAYYSTTTGYYRAMPLAAARKTYSPEWPTDFPNVRTHTSVVALKAHPAYNKAKEGSTAAAIELIEKFAKPELLRSLAADYPNPIWVAVHAEEKRGRNKIPNALAHYAAALTNSEADEMIVQTTKTQRTGEGADYRLLNLPDFDGMVAGGRNYILVDDVVSMGGTLAELRAYIEERGGKVVAMTSMSASQFGAKIALDPKTKLALTDKFGDSELREFAASSLSIANWQGLTEGEARWILRQPTLERARDRLAQGRQSEQFERVSSLLEEEIQQYLNFDNVAVPTSKQPAARAAIRALDDVSATPYPVSPARGSDRNRDRLADLRDRAQRAWGGLTGLNREAIAEAFKQSDTISSLLHDFVRQDIPHFDIRGAIIESAADFAAFNLAVRSPYFESLKVAVIGDGNQVIHSQIVHVGSLNESIADPKRVASIIASARVANPKQAIQGFVIAHNHPSGDPTPSDADRRITRRFEQAGAMLGVPLIDHVVTNGSKYFSFRESGSLGGESIAAELVPPLKPRSPKLPVLATPERPNNYNLADWEVVASGVTGLRPSLLSPDEARDLIRTLGTADPDHLHALYLDTRFQLRAVERIPVSSSPAKIIQTLIQGAAREGGLQVMLGKTHSSNDPSPSSAHRQLVRTVQEALSSVGLMFADSIITAANGQHFSFREFGLMETPAMPLAMARKVSDTRGDETASLLARGPATRTRITGGRLTAEQGQAVSAGWASLLQNALREPAADWTGRPDALAQSLASAFNAPILEQSELDRIRALPVNADGIESTVYLDRPNGVIYKRLADGLDQPSAGIWPTLAWTVDGKLDWEYNPATRARHLGLRLGVMTAIGGTPTEVYGIDPEGHLYLTQPLSPNPGIGRDPDALDNNVLTLARRRAGIIEIPGSMIAPAGLRAYVVAVHGRPWFVTDLHPDNFIADNQGNARVNDPVIGQITPDMLSKVAGFGSVVKQAIQEEQRLGDRSSRLFMASKTSQETLANRAWESIISDDSRAGAGSGGNPPMEVVSALSNLRASAGANQGQSQRQNRSRERLRQSLLLQAVARSQDLPGRFVADEGEHRVYHGGNTAHKATNNDKFGYVLDQDENAAHLKLALRPALPSEYLERLGLQNVLFGDQIKVSGIQKSYVPSIQSIQPWITGKTPSMPSIIAWMQKEGWRHLPAAMIAPGVPKVLAWYHPGHGVLAFDTKPSNFVTVGERIVAIDLSLTLYPEELLEDTARTNGIDWQSWLNEAPDSKPLFAARKTIGGRIVDAADAAASLVVSAEQAVGLESPLQKLGWNHLDKALSSKLAAHTRWMNEKTGAGETVAGWMQSEKVKPFTALGNLIKRELFPDSVLPREITARLREMNIKSSMGAQRAMDLTRALSGTPKFSDIVYPTGFAENPIHRRHLYEAMAGMREMSTLSPELQALAKRLRSMLVEIGTEAVKQGRMSLDTFAGLQETYMPHFYEEDVAREKSFLKRFALGVKDIFAQRTTAWHVVDLQTKDKTGEPRLVSYEGNRWRFKNKEHRDAWFEEFIAKESLDRLQSRDKQWRSLTLADLNKRSALPAEARGRLQEIENGLRARYRKEKPLSLSEQEKAGLILDPVYSIARYAAQMVHDNSTAEFFNFVASKPEWISDTATPGFTQIPDNTAFGRLAGKYVENDIHRQLTELVETPNAALRLYDTILSWWKAGKTVYNPSTHARNLMGNIPFAIFAGSNPLNPGNLRYYRDAVRHLRNGGQTLTEAYEDGVLGADFVSAELRQTLRQLLPDPATIDESERGESILFGIGKAIGQVIPHWAKNPLHKLNNQVTALYQAEDEVYKLAAYLKAQEMGMTRETAAAHVRKWFPYYDVATSATLKGLQRTAMPFLSFYRESIRIFGHAVAERPLALATSVAIPSIITLLSAIALGVDDDELEQIRKDMRGKGGKLLGPTPLAGVPLFSMLLPFKSGTGTYQQFDISAVHPFADHLGNRVETDKTEDGWQRTWRSMLTAGPIGNLVYAQVTGRDAFGDRPFVEDNMTSGEKLAARLDNLAKTALPPLTPFVGTGFETMANSGEVAPNKSLEFRSPGQAVARALFGVDVRNATPDIYRIAEDWRKANNIPTTEGMDFSATTPTSRARKELFKQLAQPEPNLAAIKNLSLFLEKQGSPVRTADDVRKLLFYRDPLMIIRGKENQQRFRASLTGLERDTLENALSSFKQIEQRAPGILMQALSNP